MKHLPITACVGCVLGSLPLLGAVVVFNPSFEDPVLPYGTYGAYPAGTTIGSGWVVDSAGVGAALIGEGYVNGGVVWPAPSDGKQFLFVGNGLDFTVMHQDVSLAAGVAYSLTFDLASFLSSPFTANLNVDILDLSTSTSVIGGPQAFTRPALSGFAEQQLDFTTAGAGSYRVVLDSPGGYGNNVDNFELTMVPEPATWGAFIGLGLLGFGAFRRMTR